MTMSEVVIRAPLVSEAIADAATRLITPVGAAKAKIRVRGVPVDRVRSDAHEKELRVALAGVSGWFMFPPG